MKSVAHHFVLLQHELMNINEIFTHQDVLTPPDQRFHIEQNSLVLDENFTFSIFEHYITSLAPSTATISFLQQHFPYLQNEMDELHSAIKHLSLENTKPLQWTHLELSPNNFGFDNTHKVKYIFDIDSINRGVLLQDLGWLLATFCIDYRFDVTATLDKISIILPTILSGLELQYNWHKYLPVFMRMGYLDTLYRKIFRYYNADDTRLGFVKQDIQSLLWLRQNQNQLSRYLEGL